MDNQETGPIEVSDVHDIDSAAEYLRQQPAQEAPDEVQDEPPAETETDDTPEPQEESRQFVTIKIDGKEEQVPLDEAIAGYQRQKDYTRKTTEIAELRKAAEAERQAAQQEREYYANQLSGYMSSLTELVSQDEKVDWAKLLETNPIEYLKQKEAADQRKIHLETLGRQQQAIAEQQQLENQRYIQQLVQEESSKLLERIPEWKDDKKSAEEKKAVAEYLIGYGYSSDEVSSVTDHRAVVLARKAMLYDKLQASKSTLNQRVEKLPPRIEKPGSSVEAGPRDKAALSRLRSSGSVDDAAAVLAARLRK